MTDLLTPYKSVLYINSVNRVSGTPQDFIVNLSGDLIQPNNYDSIVLISACIPKSYYTISLQNNSFYLVENGTSTLIQLTPGNIDAITLATTLGSFLTLYSQVGASYNVTLNVSKGIYTFETTTPLVTTSLDFRNSNLAYVIGFDKSLYTFSGTTLVAPSVVNLQSTSIVNVYSDLVGGSGSKKLAQIVPNQSDFSLIVYQETCPSYVSRELSRAFGTSARFWFTDAYNNLLNLNGINTQLTVTVYKSDDYHKRMLISERLKMIEDDINRETQNQA